MVKNPLELSDDILVSYADNELPEEEYHRLTPLIAADPEASRKVEAFRQSAEQLLDYFSVDTPEETAPNIAEKIRSIEVTQASSDDVVSLASYRRRLSRSFQTLSSGAGFQKIAAALFIGIFVGIGGTSQFGYLTQTDVNKTSQKIEVRGARIMNKMVRIEREETLQLKTNERSFRSGSAILKSERYRIQIHVANAEKVSLIYHEHGEAPVTLIERKSVGSHKTIEFPETSQNGIKIDTDAPFVTFELLLEGQGKFDQRYFVFGIE